MKFTHLTKPNAKFHINIQNGLLNTPLVSCFQQSYTGALWNLAVDCAPIKLLKVGTKRRCTAVFGQLTLVAMT